MQLTSAILVAAAALGVTAHPSGHLHLHRSAHEKREPAFYKAIHTKIPTPTVTAAAPPPAGPTAQGAAAGIPPAGSKAKAYKAFCAGANAKRASQEDIAAKGNIGVAGNWGCNMMTIDASIADKYDYTAVYTNVGDAPIAVVCFNKIGPDGASINGFFYSGLTFTLAPHTTQVLAFDDNTQGGCAHAPHSVPQTSYGEHAGVWVEFDFGSTRNGGWSGADCSSLVAESEGLPVPGCEVCHEGTCSTIYPGGAGKNAFIKGTAEMDGLGINAPAGPVKLEVKVGFTGS